MARMERDPGEIYQKLTQDFSELHYQQGEASANVEQKALASPRQKTKVKP